MQVSVLGFVRASVRNSVSFTLLFITDRGMAKVQIVFAMTIDGYFPDDDRLMEWIREDRNGFLLWKQHGTFSIAPDYPMVDLICFKDTTSSDSIFQAIISEREDTEILRRLSVYHLPDEIVIYMLPVISGHGIRISDFLDSCSWNLHSSKVSVTVFAVLYIAKHCNSFSQLQCFCNVTPNMSF